MMINDYVVESDYEVENVKIKLNKMTLEEKRWVRSRMTNCVNCGVLFLKTDLEYGRCVICNKNKSIREFRRLHSPDFNRK